jgi:glycosyltransferase involved in cell wall biosynthesis
MKILMLGWELPPRNSGGLGVACYHLCSALADAGVTIDFVMPFALPSDASIGFMQVHATRSDAPTDAHLFGGYANWSEDIRSHQRNYQHKVEALIASNDYDAIHAHDWLTLEAGVLAKKLTGKPLVAHVHSTEYDRCGQTTGNPLVHEIEQTCLAMADRIIAVSEATKTMLVDRYGLPADNIEVVYSMADPALLTLPRDESNTYVYLQKMQQLGYKVVVSLGRLTIQKGLYHLLHAAKAAISKNPKLLFLIVGDGEQRDELVALSAELGISEHVIFTGFLRGKQWRDAYTIGDMFVMSSVSEPYGLTALEAAGLGTAVILTKQSGVSEVLRSSLRFDFWDTKQLADYIVAVAEQPALQRTLAHDARAEVGMMSWQTASDKLQTIYRSLAGAAV